MWLLIMLVVFSNTHLSRGDYVTCQALADLHLARRKEGCRTRTAFIKCYSLVDVVLAHNQTRMHIFYGNKSASIDIHQDMGDHQLQSSVLVQVIVKDKKSETRTYQNHDLNNYRGVCLNELNTVFYGTVRVGHVDGYIMLPQGKFLIEPSEEYFDKTTSMTDNRARGTQHVFYSSEDLGAITAANARHMNGEGAASQTSRHYHLPRSHSVPLRAHGHHSLLGINNATEVVLAPNIMRFKDHAVNIVHKQKLHAVRKYCTLAVYLDHKFMRYSARRNIAGAIASAMSMIGMADKIFRHTDFDGDGLGDNVGFRVKNITAFLTSDMPGYKLGGRYVTKGKEFDGSVLLENFKQYNFDDVCLGVLFTYRDLDDGLLGLAWRATVHKNGRVYGGICHKRPKLTKNPEFSTSSNTLFVTQYNNRFHVPKELLGLTFTHELGHAFGAPHYVNKKDKIIPPCAAENGRGHWLMHPQSGDGSKPNNYLFDACSRAAIFPVIHKVGRNCFEYETEPRCGNMLVEEGEECDCGNLLYCSKVDHCCLPPRPAGKSAEFIWFPPDPEDKDQKPGRECTIARNYGYKCSPAASLCCDEDCQIAERAERRLCAMETECLQAAMCDGSSAECPAQEPKPDRVTHCLQDSGVCIGGKCVSLCVLRDEESCECDHELMPDFVCQVCCKPTGPKQRCWPAFSLGLTTSNSGVPYRYPGAACNASAGICDAKHQCVEYANDDPSSSGEEAVEWLQRHSNYLTLVAGGLAIITVLICILLQIKRREKQIEERHSQIQLAASSYAVALDVKLKQVHERYYEAVRRLNEGQHKNLKALFPSATPAVRRNTALSSQSDQEALLSMVAQGYPAMPSGATPDEIQMTQARMQYL